MLVTLEQIQMGLIKYIESGIANKATGFTKFIIYFSIPSLPSKVSQMLSNLYNSQMYTDLFDETGKVKLDEAYARAKSAIQKSGKILISSINYFIDEADIDSLYEIIKRT